MRTIQSERIDLRIGRTLRHWSVGAAMVACLLASGAAHSQSTLDLAGIERKGPGNVIVLPGLSSQASAGSLPSSGLAYRHLDTETATQLLSASLEPGSSQQKGQLLPGLTIYSRSRIRTARVGSAAIGIGGMSVHCANFDANPGQETVVGIYRDSANGEVLVELPAANGGGSGKQKASPVTLLRIKTVSERAGLGRAIASGDINGDGHRDLILGASTEGLPDRALCGLIYVIFGPLSGLGSELILDSQNTEQELYTVIYGEAERYFCGYSLTCGDIDGDGLDDVVIGAPEAVNPVDEGMRSGRIYVVHGASEFSPALDLHSDEELAGGFSETRILRWYSSSNTLTPHFNQQIYPRLGFSLDCGDVDADGYDDILAGSPGASFVGLNKPQAGQCYLLFGGPEYESYTPPVGDLEELLPTHAAARFGHQQAGAMLGNAVALGDLSGDGNADLVLGAWRTDSLGREDNGCVYVTEGGDHLRGTIAELTAEGPETIVIGGRSGDFFGSNLVADDDFNGDGIADLAVSALGFGLPSNNKSGAIYIFTGLLQPAQPAPVLPDKPKKSTESAPQPKQAKKLKGAS